MDAGPVRHVARPTDVLCVVVWPRAAGMADRVRTDLEGRFRLLGSRRLLWSPAAWKRNLRRFYGYDVSVRDKAAASLLEPLLC